MSANHSSGVPCGQTCSDPGSNSEAPRTLVRGRGRVRLRLRAKVRARVRG